MASSVAIIGIVLAVIFFLFKKIRLLIKTFWGGAAVLIAILMIGSRKQLLSAESSTWFADTWLAEMDPLYLSLILLFYCLLNYQYVDLHDRKKEIDKEFEAAKQHAHEQSISNRIHDAARKKMMRNNYEP